MTRQEQIFIGFKTREGWTVEQAKKEIEFLTGKDRDGYFMTTRIGSTRRLSRMERVFVWESWMNASNHASFEVEFNGVINTKGF